jgi:MoaA/NifB/PqqE/SkfB family radical SAM enzyme
MKSVNSHRLNELRVEFATFCNHKCGYCYLRDQQRDATTTLPESIFHKVLEACIALGLRTVSFTGGEPLLSFKTLLKFIRIASNAGLETGVLTNGTLVSPDKADQLCKAGLNWARISVDADPSDMQVQKRLDRFFPNIDQGIGLFIERSVPVILRPTVTRQNTDALAALFDYSYDQGVTRVEIQPYMPCGVNVIDMQYQMDAPTHLTVLDEMLRLRRKWEKDLSIRLYSGWFEFLSPEYRGEKVHGSHCGRSFIFLDSAGRFKTCAMSKRYLCDARSELGMFKDLWYEHPYLVDLQEMTPTGICAECEWFSICNRSWCPAVNTIFNLPVNAPIPICPKVMFSNKTDSNRYEQKEKAYAPTF